MDDAIILTQGKKCKCGKTQCLGDDGRTYWLKKDVIYTDHGTKNKASGIFIVKPETTKLIKQ